MWNIRVLQLGAVAWVPGDLALPDRRAELRPQRAKMPGCVVPQPRDWPRSSPSIFTSIGATQAARWTDSSALVRRIVVNSSSTVGDHLIPSSEGGAIT